MKERVVPRELIEAVRRGDWPTQPFPGSLLPPVAPFMSKMSFELLSLEQIQGNQRSAVADIETLRRFATRPNIAVQYRLYQASNPEGPAALPWLDVDQAMILGGGASYGDDTWIALDFRSSSTEPQVVINEFRRDGPKGNQKGPSRCTWLELTPNIAALLKLINATRP